jgi:hypothetical protein
MDLDQQMNRLNDKFPINYFHREKIEKLAPLRFEHIYYNHYDRFQVVETGGVFRIDSRANHLTKEYLFHHISGSRDIQPGYTTFYLGNDQDDVMGLTQRSPFTKLRYLLGAKDYYNAADILYDLANEVNEIPDSLFNYILEICDEANFSLQRQ